MRRSCLLLLATTLVGACARAVPGHPPGDTAASGSTGSGNFTVTAEQILASGATTAWDALRRLVPFVHLRESRGRPARITRRGTASIYLDDQVRVMLDNVRIHDIRMLDQIPAGEILTIQVLNGPDATTYYGGSSTSGLILIRTKTGS